VSDRFQRFIGVTKYAAAIIMPNMTQTRRRSFSTAPMTMMGMSSAARTSRRRLGCSSKSTIRMYAATAKSTESPWLVACTKGPPVRDIASLWTMTAWTARAQAAKTTIRPISRSSRGRR